MSIGKSKDTQSILVVSKSWGRREKYGMVTDDSGGSFGDDDPVLAYKVVIFHTA